MHFLHVGFPKCASTFLQESYFSTENGYFNLLLHAPHDWRRFIQHRLLAEHSSVYAGDVPPLPEKEIVGKNVGLSSSDFVTAGVDYFLALKRWHALFPDSKVLIVTRAQPELVYSWYEQFVRAGYYRGIEDFTKELIWDAQKSIWGRMLYDRVYEITVEQFSEVKVVPYELLREDYTQFLSQLNQFFGRDISVANRTIRPSSPDMVIRITRILNRIFKHGLGLSNLAILPSYVVGAGRGQANNIQLPIELRRREEIRKWSHRVGSRLSNKFVSRKTYCDRQFTMFEDYFGESNRRLEELTEINLRRFNYPGI